MGYTIWIICFVFIICTITYLFDIKKDSMIKKILWFLTFILLSISFSSAYTCNSSTFCYDIPFGVSPEEMDYSWKYIWTVVDNAFNFSSNYFNYTALRSNNLERKLNYWWQSDWLYYTSIYWNLSSPKNWKINWYYVCSQIPYMQTAYRTLSSANFCTYHAWFSDLWTYLNWSDNYSVSCWSSTSYTNCMVCVYKQWDWNYICIDNWNTSNNDNKFLEITQIETLATLNPFVSVSNIPDYTFTGWSTIDIRSDIDDYIQFYEDNFNWDINMCYVWTYDTWSVYGTPWIDFIYWSWNTIYWLYYWIYNTFWSNRIHNVGAFVNTYLLNYATWFETPAQERLYQATYNWPDQNVTYIYTWFTFPFADKSVAIYFMSDLLSTRYITESSQGENIVFYCDMKLNYENYKNWSLSFTWLLDMVDNKIKDRIEDWKDWGLPWTGWYSVPDNTWFWSTQIVSWYNIPNDLNPTSLFQDTFSKLTNLVKSFTPTWSWIIPWWILYPMIFLILFRMLRH